MTTDTEILLRAARLAEAGAPFALATVVAREPPSSARPGARALIEADGTLHGWLGGSCIEPTVRREAAEALAEGEPRLVVFAPDGEADRPGAVVHPMTCHSGGTVEVHVEPQLPAPVLVLYGDSPVSRALAAMAPAAGYRVRAVGAEGAAAYGEAEIVERGAGSPEPDGGAGPDGSGARTVASPRPTGGGGSRAPDISAVVATMGEWDEEAVRAALDAGAGYVGMVASPRRAEAVRERLEAAGAAPGGRLVSPAGLDLGAREPGEIAVTILAELVERRARRRGEATASARGCGASGDEASGGHEASGDDASPSPSGPEAAAEAVDPVCGMAVSTNGDPPTAEHDGVAYHFCCGGCRATFRQDPEAYTAAAGTT